MRKVVGEYGNLCLVDEGDDRGRIVDLKYRLVCPVGRMRQISTYYPWSKVESEMPHVIEMIEEKLGIRKERQKMRMKMSDVIDRWTILRMQARFDETAKKELNIFDHEIHEQLQADLKSAIQSGSDIGGMGGTPRMSSATFLNALLDLMEANAKIWENESAIRNANQNDPANSFGIPSAGYAPYSASVQSQPSDWLLKEVGRRTLLIRDYNKQRIKAKQAIDQLFGDILGIKVDHASDPREVKKETEPYAATYDVVLVRIPDVTRKIAVIKVIRELTSLGLKEAKDLADKTPSLIFSGRIESEAEDAKYKIEKEGGWVELRRTTIK